MFNAVQTRQSVQVKAFSTLDSLIPAQLDPAVLEKNVHEHRVLDYLPAQAISAPSYEIIVHSSTTGSPTNVVEGAQKPEIILNTTSQTLTAIKLACHVAVSYESAMDFAGWVGYTQGETIRLLQDVENAQLLNGSGSGGDMTGFLNTSGILTHDFSADPGGYTGLDAVEASIAQLRVSSALAEPDIAIFHPQTWAALRRTKSSTGQYILSDPSTSAVNSLWGVKVIVTTAQTAGVGLLIDTQKACKVYVREGITSHVGTNNDDFTKNLYRMVLEERLVLGVTRPAAVLSIANLPTS
jgi:HK97 family phage major capsid protein